jgi:hypothetical protein
MEDERGHIKDSKLANKEIGKVNNLDYKGFFQSHSLLTFFSKKSERIISALYLVSNFFDNEDPIKWKTRTLGVELVTKAGHLSFAPTSDQEALLLELRKVLLEIESVLQVLHVAQMISPMNYRVLSSEAQDLAGLIPKQPIESPKEGEKYINDAFFFVEPYTSEVYPELLENRNKQNPLKESVLYKGHSIKAINQKDLPTLVGKISQVSIQKNSRRELIVGTVKKIGNVTIKDITFVIKDCSEKTLQRELLALVEENVLRKQGERRWSRYSLA